MSSSPIHGQVSRRCMCAPTSHPGSFRCSYHKQAVSKEGTTTIEERRRRGRDVTQVEIPSRKQIELAMSIARAAVERFLFMNARKRSSSSSSSSGNSRRKNFRRQPSRFWVMHNTDQIPGVIVS
ncbi:hypothetical protein MLD38_014963 [Melastoma candidum]|uniref:Uncharacterized protein n=1 Tax=Melastoma candidum TaxID=119954 RepID=A0ACB9RIQ9_9MYRT|nr:hypothetical protein MLD38_014963 [Melastoma candidum]